MGIGIDKVGNRIHVKPIGYLGGDKFSEYLHLVKQVPGSTYSRTQKCQTAPLDLEVCRVLRELFGRQLVVGGELTAWAKQAVEAEKEALQVHTLDLTKPVELVRVPELAPRMYEAMCARGYQPVAAKFGALIGSHINADEPGLGKSIEMFGALVEGGVRGRALIFAPTSALRATWEYEINKWLGDLPGGVGIWVADGDTKNRRAVMEDYAARSGQEGHYLDFLLVNPEMLRLKEYHSCPLEARDGLGRLKVGEGCDGTDPYCDQAAKHSTRREGAFPEIFDIVWNAAIGDEMHKYMTNANPKARQRMSQVGLGIHRIPRADNGVRIALTGTPMKGKPRLVWPVLHWLRPDYYTSEGRFKEMYLESVPDAYTYNGKRYLDVIRDDRVDAFHRELGRIMIRRTKPELRAINPAWAPPDKMYHYIPITLSKPQRKQYEQAARGQLNTAEGDTMLVNGTLAVRTRQKQLAGCSARISSDNGFTPCLPSAKFDWLVENLLASLGITGDEKTEMGEGKVVVASQFTQFINLWATELRRKGIQCFVLTGDTSTPERLRQQQEFQANKPGSPRVFLINTYAGGVSLTLDAASDLVVMDRTENPDDQTQVEDRIHRTSRTDHQVNIWYPSAVDTIDDEIFERNEFKDNNQRRHLDERRGVAFAKQLASAGEV